MHDGTLESGDQFGIDIGDQVAKTVYRHHGARYRVFAYIRLVNPGRYPGVGGHANRDRRGLAGGQLRGDRGKNVPAVKSIAGCRDIQALERAEIQKGDFDEAVEALLREEGYSVCSSLSSLRPVER